MIQIVGYIPTHLIATIVNGEALTNYKRSAHEA